MIDEVVHAIVLVVKRVVGPLLEPNDCKQHNHS